MGGSTLFLSAVLLLSSVTAVANTITQMTIVDVTGDGLSGCFRFSSLDTTTCSGASTFNSTGPIVFGTVQGVNSFSTGFVSGGGTGKPITFDAPQGEFVGGALSTLYFPFGIIFSGGTSSTFLKMDPDPGTLMFLVLADNGNGSYNYLMTWNHVIQEPGAYNGFRGFLRLEGVVTTIPLPGALWLFMSGAMALLAASRRRALTLR